MRPLTFSIVVVVLITIGGYLLLQVAAVQNALLQVVARAAMTPPKVKPFDGIKVFMCGTSSPLPSPDRAQSCVAVWVNDSVYLVDAGAGSTGAIRLGAPPIEKLKAIFVTHYHSDHISGIADFNLNSWVAGREQPLTVMGPRGVSKVVNGLNTAYELDRSYRVAHHGKELLPIELGAMTSKRIKPGVVLKENGLQVTAFIVDHSPVSPAFGYRFEYQGRTVVVSGDTITEDNILKFSRGADLLLHDALSLPIIKIYEEAAKANRLRIEHIFKDIQDYHASVADVVAMAEKAQVGTLALYHFVPPPDNILLKNMYLRELPEDVVMTKDGMWFELPANSKEIKVY